jgi:hypothetical protein
MSWKLVIGIEPYVLTDQEKDFYLAAIAHGEEHIQIKRGLFVSPHYQSLAEFNDNNPILNSPTWVELQSLKEKGDDTSVRRKMALEKSINTQFPYEKYVSEWDEANRQSKALVKV